MRVYWRKVKRGENLILSDENDAHEEELGGFRDTKRGIDASAKTFSYDPSRSRKGFPSIEEAKDFVESFRPWELFGAQGVTVDPGVRPAPRFGHNRHSGHATPACVVEGGGPASQRSEKVELILVGV